MIDLLNTINELATQANDLTFLVSYLWAD